MVKSSIIPGIIYLGLLSLLLVSCAGKTTSAPAPQEGRTARIEQVQVKETWETEWEIVLKEAKKEGKLILYTTAPAAERQALSEALKEYGLNLESITARPAELSEKILRESRAGIYDVDFAIAGMATYYPGIKAAAIMAPLEPLLILPEINNPEMWYKGEVPFADKDKMLLAYAAFTAGQILINKDIVKPGDIKSFHDLLAPRWQRKIIMDDPTAPGRTNQIMSIITKTRGEEYLKQFVKQKPTITRDLRQIVDWIAKGRYAIGIGLAKGHYAEHIKAGAPVEDVIVPEIKYLSAGINYIVHFNKAPHPNASRVLLNWLLSKKGQMTWAKAHGYQSARVDIPIDYYKELGIEIREPGVDYFDTINESWSLEERPRLTKVIIEAFAPLLR